MGEREGGGDGMGEREGRRGRKREGEEQRRKEGRDARVLMFPQDHSLYSCRHQLWLLL
jgi:hypothetical protein